MISKHKLKFYITLKLQVFTSKALENSKNQHYSSERNETYIFRVPFGPRFDFMTSCKFFAAVILICKVATDRANSALGFKHIKLDILTLY